ncbi:exo-alpha-sialidase [Arthrobacter frigidicola]|nr:exo-alpha-sialidase [Arthrobacter frigidicola]
MSIDPATNRILLATHDGLFDVSQAPAVQVGPTIDLMGFTTGADGTLYASGHPSPGTDLPNPVGLIESTDAGQSWRPLSRQGESDFHALAATSSGLVGHDGELLTSTDKTKWEPSAADIPAHHLAGSTTSDVVLATTEDGLQRSADSGRTWSPVPGAPLLALTAFAGSDAVGIAADGQVHTSIDGGLTWRERGTIDNQPAAIAATRTSDGTLRVWAATDSGVQVSSDNGLTFTDLAVPGGNETPR